MTKHDEGNANLGMPDDIAYAVAGIAKLFTSMHRDLMVAKAQADSGDEAKKDKLRAKALELQGAIDEMRAQLAEFSG